MKSFLTVLFAVIVIGGGLGWVVSHAFKPTPAKASPAPTPKDVEQEKYLRQRDAAITRCRRDGNVVAMGFNFDVICIHREHAVNLTRFK